MAASAWMEPAVKRWINDESASLPPESKSIGLIRSRTVGINCSILVGSGRRSTAGPGQAKRRPPIASRRFRGNGAAAWSSVSSTQAVTSPSAESMIW